VARPSSLYEADASEINFETVECFVQDAEEANLLSESMTLELKRQRSGRNVAEAVAALANSDGGIVLLGVDEAQSPENGRIPGVARTEVDALVGHLHGLLERLPEIIPVAIPGTDRLVIVIRVDADQYVHPVLVGGRVLFRVPGATVPADRIRVIELVERDRDKLPGARFDTSAPLIVDPQRLPLWSDSQQSWHVAVRVMGGLLLPGRVAKRPWLTTAARDAAVRALEGSLVPHGLWQSERGPASCWRVKDRRSNWLTMESPGKDRQLVTESGMSIESGSHIGLQGRDLSCLLGVRLRSNRGTVIPLGLPDLYLALLAQVVAVRETCTEIATSLDVAEPATQVSWRAWLQAESSLAVPHVVNLDPFPRDSDSHQVEAVFPAISPRTSATEDLDQLVRDWITVMMLDLGVRDFEGDLAAVQRPTSL